MEPKEFDLGKDWEVLARTTGAVFRYPVAFILIVLTSASLSWLFTMTRAPVFSASSTLRLEDPNLSNPVLAKHDIPVGTTDVEEALAVLRSQALMQRVVAPPGDGRVPTPEHPDWGRHLGLTTQVDDETHLPLRGLVADLMGGRSADFRVYGLVDEAAPGAPDRVRLRFLDDHRVVISRVGSAPGIEWPGDEPRLYGFEEGVPVEYDGLIFRLAVRGEPDGRSFVLRHMSPGAAARTFHERLDIDRPADQKSLMRVRVDDSDPVRAAAVANAVSQTFLAMDREEALAKADRNMALVEGQLEAVQDELDGVEAEIAALLSDNLDALDPEASTLSLMARRSAAETQSSHLASVRDQLRAMVAALEAGQHSEVSRIGPDLDDAFVRKLLEQAIALQSDLLNVDRDGVNDYKQSIQVIRNEKLDLLDEIEGRYSSLDAIVRALEAGDTAVLSRLGASQSSEAAVTLDWMTRQYLTELGTQRIRLQELRAEYVDGYELIEIQENRIAETEAMVLALLRSQRDGLAGPIAQAREAVARWNRILSEHPDDERAQIAAGISDLWLRIERGLRSRLRGVETEIELVENDLDRVDRRLATLPLTKQALAEPTRRRAALRVKVGEWIQDRAQVAFARAGVPDTARLIDPALPPEARSRPDSDFGLLVGLVLGLVLATAGTMAYERFRGRPRSGTELEDAAGAPLLAVVPTSGPLAREHGCLPIGGDPSGPAAEAYRTLRARLEGRDAGARSLRAVGVTSSLPGEGKTRANAGLALAYAMEGRRVLLVDANLRAPGLADAFELPSAPGLAEALDGRRHWLQSRQPTPYRGLDLLVAGDPYYSPGDLLGGQALVDLLEDALEDYDVVVFDLPPVEGLPDVAAVAPRLDALLLLHNAQTGPPTATVCRVVRELARGGALVAGTVHVPAGSKLRRRRAQPA